MLLALLAVFVGMGIVFGAGAVIGLLAALVLAGLLAAGMVTSSMVAGLLARKWSTGLWLLTLQVGTLAGAAVGAGALSAAQMLWQPFSPAEAPWLAATLGGAAGGLLLAITLSALCRWIARLLQARYGAYLANTAPM